MESFNLCTLCGGTGWTPEGKECPNCKEAAIKKLFNKACTTIPTAYRGIVFNRSLVKSDLGDEYPDKLETIYKDVCTVGRNKRNYLIASPPKHSKTVLAYSAIQQLFNSGEITFPLLDLNEIRRLILDMEAGKHSYVIDDMDAVDTSIYDAPILFIKVPDLVTYSTLDTLMLILDRRTRRSKSTVFIYNGSWNTLTKIDKRGYLKALDDDGTMGTLFIYSAYSRETEETDEDTAS